MKKTLLSIFAIFAIATANATTPELLDDWMVTVDEGAPKDAWGSWARACGGYNGELYVYQANGTFYKFSKATEANNVTVTTSTMSTTDLYRGSGPHFDDAGNAVFITNYTSVPSGNILKLWNSTTNELKDLTIDLPEGYVQSRMDYIGKPIGDLFGDGGAIFLFSKDNTSILKVNIANSVVTGTKLINVGVKADAVTIVQPLTLDPNSDDIVYRIGANKSFYYNNGTEWVAYEAVGNLSTTGGGALATIEGELYTIEPSKADNEKTFLDGFQVVNRKTNTVVATHNAASTVQASSQGATFLCVEQIDEKTANIYQIHSNAFVAKYVLTTDQDVITGVEETMVDANAPVEYYNLQGVKVSNPENGIFIKRQGAKATKVVL